jgi:Flp pilus assembly pilin Flp
MKTWARTVVSFLKKEEGVSAVECALLLALVIIICIVAISPANPAREISEPVVVSQIR